MLCIYWNLVGYAYFLVFAYYAYHYILCIFCSRPILERCFFVHYHNCFVPHPMAQLFMYHHLRPSLPFFVLLPRESLCFSAHLEGCCPGTALLPTGTRGNRPSMEDTGMMYKTFAVSLRSYTMVGCHTSKQAVQESNQVIYYMQNMQNM